MRNYSANQVGVALAASVLSATLFGSIAFIWPLGFAAALLSPLPMAYVGWRGPFAIALAALVIAAAPLAVFLGAGASFEYLAQFGLAGLLLGYGVRKKWSPHLIIGVYAGCGLAGFAVLIGLESVSLGITPLELIEMLSKQWTAPLREAFLAEQLDAEMLASTQLMLDELEQMVVTIPFGLLAGIGLFTGWANALVFRRLLTARGHLNERWTTWNTPESWIWGLIVAGAMTLVGDEVISAVGYNLLIPMVLVYFFQGLAIIQNLFEARSTPRFFRAMLFALIFLQMHTMVIFVAVAGAFDQWLDYRTRLSPQADTTG